MDFNTYQENIRLYANYHKELGPFSVILDLINNVGRLGDKLHIILEENEGTFTPEDKAKISISLGDIINNISNISSDLGLKLNDIIALNLKKLEMIQQKNESLKS